REVIHREKYDFAVARAVARLNTLCEYCMPFVKVGGKFIAYKGGAEEEIKEAANAVEILGGELEKIEQYELPNGEKRTLIIIKKVAHTPRQYPRGQGKERKAPLI
ncbi:MAG: class I SAM-dependent methyltransferase, partial [Clostridia bacterium]|nr:class I SAM-dependent methyltransferase [Clostridia bacterium]